MNNNCITIILIIDILIFLYITTIEGKLINLVNYYSEIHLVIIESRGNTINILYDQFAFKPYEFKIIGNNATLYFDDTINTCENMFYQLNHITEIDLSKFDFSIITSTKNMFFNCTKLKKIDFGNINTSSLTSMESMFGECKELKSIDLTKFDTSKITSLNSFLKYCEKLEYIDISSFNTSLVTDMEWTFFHCYSLKIIVFPENLDITKVTNFNAMFSHCTSLIALNLTKFNLNTNIDIHIWYMFNN